MTSAAPVSAYISFLWAGRARRRIAAATVCGAAVGLVYGLLAPPWFRSSVTFVPVKSQKAGGITSLLGGDLASLAAGFDVSGGGAADVARITAVLQSADVSDTVIERFDLRGRYRQKHPEDLREALWRHCSVRSLPRPNLVQLSCEDKDPQFVRDMLAFFAEYGNQVFRRVGASSASEEVRFLDKRVVELRQQADEVAARMRAFQERHQIVDLETQARAVVSSVATLNSQRITKQMELEYARTFSSRDEPANRQLESQLSVVDDTLRDLELAAPSSSRTAAVRQKADGGAGMFPPALAVPRLRAEYEALLRDRKVTEAVLVFAMERLEGARANEARDVSTFQVLDPPTRPTKKSRPKSMQTAFVASALAFAAAIAFEGWAELRVRRERRKTDASGRPSSGGEQV